MTEDRETPSEGRDYSTLKRTYRCQCGKETEVVYSSLLVDTAELLVEKIWHGTKKSGQAYPRKHQWKKAISEALALARKEGYRKGVEDSVREMWQTALVENSGLLEWKQAIEKSLRKLVEGK